MRLKSLALSTTSIAVLAFSATPVMAQDQPTPGGAQDPATTSSAAAAEESIVVTGLRRSLESAQNIRRNSDQIIDAVVAEDIGKLPDITVSDTAARIPGVQVERGGGEAGRVLVRGLGDTLYSTTYNGREIFTAERRSVALQDFPSGLVGAVEVFKTSTADLVEPGLGGLVNVRSRRPFDFDGFEIAGSVWGLYSHQSDTITPNGNILVSNRWDVGDGGEIGALVGFSYTNIEFLDSTRANTDFVAGGGPNGTRWPDIQRITYGTADRRRPSMNAAIQYRPTPDLEFYVEGLWQGFRNRISDRETSVPLWGGSGFSDFRTREGRPDLLEAGTVVDPFRPDGFQGGTYNKTDTYQFAVGGSYDAGPLRIAADLARTDSTFTGSTASVDFAFAERQTVTFDTDVDSEVGGAEFSFENFDPSNPANYVYRGFYEEAQQSQGDDWQARLDFDYETGLSFLPQIDFGVRFTDRDAHREFGNRYWNFEGERLPFSAVPLDYRLFRPGFRGSNVQRGYRNWLSPTYRSIRDNLLELRRFNIALGPTQYGVASEDAPPQDPLATWDASEKSYAAYLQARYEFYLGDVQVDGNVGLRYTRSDLRLSGTRLVFGDDPDDGGPLPAPSELVATDVDREFEDWLPNFSARIRFTPQIQARLSYTQTRTLPLFTDLRASATIDQPPACLGETPVPEGCFRTGNGGNPFLERLTSDNYDASLDWFFSRAGFASFTFFHRDLFGFVENSITEGVSLTGEPFRFTGPINSGAGNITGFEAQVTTFFDFAGLPDWMSNFGVQANVTHLDAKADFTYDPGLPTEETVNRSLLDVSDWTYNLIGMYEGHGLSVRLAYNWRSGYLDEYQRRGDHLYIEEARSVSRLDLSGSYDVFENLTVFADWTNILGDPFQNDLTRIDPDGTESTFPRIVRYEETTVSLGVRFRF
ncbi:TonB-dependent receptor [Sphingosinicella terrae]|uniref:TonB-dependent receptor n=1 Tax=Sphingosinicella terrae TaxID=2172047 RepID=UPI0013B46603|nr:TonB-dependent receptor [Sphingosinicella terrae]